MLVPNNCLGLDISRLPFLTSIQIGAESNNAVNIQIENKIIQEKITELFALGTGRPLMARTWFDEV